MREAEARARVGRDGGREERGGGESDCGETVWQRWERQWRERLWGAEVRGAAARATVGRRRQRWKRWRRERLWGAEVRGAAAGATVGRRQESAGGAGVAGVAAGARAVRPGRQLGRERESGLCLFTICLQHQRRTPRIHDDVGSSHIFELWCGCCEAAISTRRKSARHRIPGPSS